MVDDRSERKPRRLFLRRIHRRPLKYVAIFPAMITLLNGISGFASLMFASKAAETIAAGGDGDRYFMFAAYMIMVAMIADMLDGRVARMSRTTSSFGGQLDSLCDVISFGAAPAFLAVRLLAYRLTAVEAAEPHIVVFLHRIIWLAGAVYIGCAAIRLARFNVENEEDETAHMVFSGLPSPAAAGVIMSMVILYVSLPAERWLPEIVSDWGRYMIVVLLPAAVIATGLLMVSRFRYPHVLNQVLRGKKP
ncbi:MAG TPA: phosphatidylcholine/phosphatidylserine synthase, partial [Sedimentisphaerales bacterium]|nr:phosphatidylcholine/phosphatidylserine synthase [Sedimentisphaerales bacterium]